VFLNQNKKKTVDRYQYRVIIMNKLNKRTGEYQMHVKYEYVEYSKTNAGKCEAALEEIIRVAAKHLDDEQFGEIYRHLSVINRLRSEYKD